MRFNIKMSSEDCTALVEEQVKVTASNTVPAKRLPTWIRKCSTQFGWPILILFMIAPDGNWIAWVGSKATWALGSILMAAAVVLRLSSRGYDRNAFVWSGAYRHVRNPVEVGALAAYLGGGLILRIDPFFILIILLLAFWFMSWSSIYYEREVLLRVGPSYLKYMRRVRRWVPSFLPGVNRTNRDYSFRLAIWQERDGLLWLAGFALVYAFRNRLF